MYSKLVVGLAMAGAASAADIVRRDTAGGGHDHSHAHAAPAPAASYGAPAASYGAPEASYGAPEASYGAPAASYGATGASSYGGYETVGYEEEGGGFDLSTILIPILIIFGLSLLFPTVTSVSVNRKRRDIEGGKNTMHNTNKKMHFLKKTIWRYGSTALNIILVGGEGILGLLFTHNLLNTHITFTYQGIFLNIHSL